MNERHFQNLSAAVSLGFLAEDVVFAAGCALRGQIIDESGRQALKRAGDLLKAVANPRRGLALGPERRRLSDRGAVSALEAELHPSPPENLQEYATRLAGAIEHALNGGVTDAEKDQLTAVREQFASLARASLAEVSTLSRRRRKKGLWSTPTNSTSLSFTESPSAR